MEQFEKVCKGLECCVLRDPDDHRRCGECPYNPHAISNEPCANGLKYNALALIRQQQARIAELEAAQTARVMTLEEIPLFDGAIYMDEYPNPVCLKMLYCYEVGRGTYGHGYTFVDSDGDKIFFPAKEFGKKWRCWTQRPTDEQRKATKWE